MKKLFLVVAALGMLATACTKDDSAVVGNESLVSFSVSSPELMTRAEDGKGQSTNHLQYAFYDENGVYLPELEGEVANFVGSTKINISLVEGRTYSAIFWADHTDAPYEVSPFHVPVGHMSVFPGKMSVQNLTCQPTSPFIKIHSLTTHPK